MPIMIRYIKENIPNYHQAVIVSPDTGGAKRATDIASILGNAVAIVHKDRNARCIAAQCHLSTSSASTSASASPSMAPISFNVTPIEPFLENLILVGDVKDRNVILLDDIADTCQTITRAARFLTDNGARKIYALIVHGVFSGNALSLIHGSSIDEVIVSNSIPKEQHLKKSKKIKVLDIAPLFAEAIRRIHNGESVSYLFDPVPI